MTITVQRSISMGHRLPSYQGICSSPHGHNIRVEVTISVPRGEFVDFKSVDQVLQETLEPMDHAMVLQREDPLLKILQDMKFRTYPFTPEPTTENLAQHIGQMIHLRGLEVMQCTVHETDKYSATAQFATEERRVWSK